MISGGGGPLKLSWDSSTSLKYIEEFKKIEDTGTIDQMNFYLNQTSKRDLSESFVKTLPDGDTVMIKRLLIPQLKVDTTPSPQTNHSW